MRSAVGGVLLVTCIAEQAIALPGSSAEVAEVNAPRYGDFLGEISPSEGYRHYTASLSMGKGFRFNNPYRLATPLGDDAESLSFTASYLDIAFGSQWGPPDGLQHGAVLQLGIALEGIPQEVLTPSYRALIRLPPRYMLFLRTGLPIVLEPDLNAGLEVAFGSVFMLSGGVGICAELIGSVFYGAATLEKARTSIELLSLQAGVWYDYEVLP